MIFIHTDKVTPVESLSLPQTGLSGTPVDVGRKPSLCIAVIGATGELAMRKIFPALSHLFFNLKVLVHAFQKPQFIS